MFFECSPITLTDSGIFLGLFLGGLFGGATHCAFMCSPFVVMLQQKTIGRLSSILLLPYHLGRMTTYVALGVLSNLLLSYAFPVSFGRQLVSAIFLGLAGMVFLVQSIPFLARYFPFLLRVHLPLPFAPIRNFTSKLLEKNSPVTLFLVGIILGLIPCGLVMGALLAVATLDDVIKAALGMAAFAAGTIPSLLLVAIGGKTLATKLPTQFALLSKWVIVLNGILLIFLAGRSLL